MGNHFDGFISEQIKAGRYGSASEMVRASLRMLEDTDAKLQALRQALVKGEQSGFVEYKRSEFIDELDAEP